MKVNILEAKNNLSQLIKSAQAGEEVVIANRGEPVVRLVSAEPVEAVRATSGPALLAWLRAHPLPPHLQRTRAEIDAGIAEERAAWD